ncbi:MAG: hypothetical protein H7Y11_08140, partial [Armatimonadetes bacterium]|nr:hypothetical protein [Anaerolineae bacterium]
QAMIGLRQHAATLTRTDHWAMQVPVAIYFAWLNVATIANTTAAFDASGWNGEPNGAAWAAAMLVVAAGLASVIIGYLRLRPGMIAYTLVVLWAFAGLYLANAERSGLVAGTAIVAALVVIGALVLRLRPPTSALGGATAQARG